MRVRFGHGLWHCRCASVFRDGRIAKPHSIASRRGPGVFDEA
jgi:hypothetical protein